MYHINFHIDIITLPDYTHFESLYDIINAIENNQYVMFNEDRFNRFVKLYIEYDNINQKHDHIMNKILHYSIIINDEFNSPIHEEINNLMMKTEEIHFMCKSKYEELNLLYKNEKTSFLSIIFKSILDKEIDAYFLDKFYNISHKCYFRIDEIEMNIKMIDNMNDKTYYDYVNLITDMLNKQITESVLCRVIDYVIRN